MTNLYTKLIDCNEINLITKKETNRLLKKITSKDNFLIVKDSFSTITKDKVQKSLFIDCERSFEKLIKPIILNTAMESEVLSPFSGDLSFVFLLRLLSSNIDKRGVSKSIFLEEISRISSESRNDLCASSLNKIISNTTKSDHIKKIISNSIRMAGSENKIFVEPGVSEESSIELVKGYYFKRQLSQESQCFLNAENTWERKNVKTFIIDGDVTTVSDIHFLLESLSKSKRPCILIARSFSPDVLNTLHANFRRGTLDIMPIDFPFEQDTANMLVDITAACNTDIVTPLKGDLISKSCRKDLKEVKSIKVTSSGITIINPQSDRRCHSLLLNLKNRIQNEKHIEIKEILSKRITSLSGSKVIIKIGKYAVRETPTAVEEADKILRAISSATKNGTIVNRDIISKIKKIDSPTIEMKLFLESLKIFPMDMILPSASITIAAKKCLSTFHIVKNTSHGLLVDNI